MRRPSVLSGTQPPVLARSSFSASGGSRPNPVLGIGCCIAGICLFQVLNLLGKHLAESYPIPLLVFFRSLFALATTAVLVARTGGAARLRTRRPGAILLRALLWVAMLFCSFMSFHLLPVTDAVAIGFAGPIFITALAGPLLREAIGLRRWLAVVAGFLGVLLIVRPGFDVLRYGTLFALGDALLYALGSLLVRHLSSTERSVTIVFYCCLVASAISAAGLPFFWVAPGMSDFLLLCLLGILGAIAQYLSTQALCYVQASTVAPFIYSGLVWAIALGYLIWGDLPDLGDLAGIAMIVAGGLYVVQREKTGRPLLPSGPRTGP